MKHRTATSPSSSSGSPRQAPWPPVAGWAAATKKVATGGRRRHPPAGELGVDARRRGDRRRRERRSADAVQRRARRQRRRPGMRLRRRPGRRHHADEQRHAQRDLGARGGRPRRDVRPVGGVLHEQDRRGSRRRPRPRHHRTDRRQHPRGRQGQGPVGARHDGLHPGPPPARPADRRRAEHRSPDPADHRRRRGRRDFGMPSRLRHRHAGRYRRYPGGHHRRRGDPLHGRRTAGAAGTDRRRRTTEGARCRLRPRRRC